MSFSMLRALLLGVALLPSACRTTREPTSHDLDRARAVKGSPARAYALRADGALAGYLVHFESNGDPARAFYSVRNPMQQELGLIDGLGRAWRYRPFQEEPEWLYTGSVSEGARRILGAREGAKLEEISLQEAAFRPGS
jgi:hypothetical protein